MADPKRKTIRVSLEVHLLELINQHTETSQETLSEFVNSVLRKHFN